LPDTVPLTDEQFKTFLEKTAGNDYGRRTLANIAAQNAATTPPQGAKSAKRDNPAPSAKPAESASQGGAGAGTNEGESARVSD